MNNSTDCTTQKILTETASVTYRHWTDSEGMIHTQTVVISDTMEPDTDIIDVSSIKTNKYGEHDFDRRYVHRRIYPVDVAGGGRLRITTCRMNIDGHHHIKLVQRFVTNDFKTEAWFERVAEDGEIYTKAIVIKTLDKSTEIYKFKVNAARVNETNLESVLAEIPNVIKNGTRKKVYGKSIYITTEN